MARRAVRGANLPTLFLGNTKQRHPRLFLPKLLAQEAERRPFEQAELDRARAIALSWADLAERGHLNQKETALDAEFLQKIFGEALGYRSIAESPTEYEREKQFTVHGGLTADGALGRFASGAKPKPVAVIELKGATTDLAHDRSAGRTPVQQCWDYLNQLPETPWGIVSNYVTIRLYHRDFPQRAYEEFTVQDFRDQARFRQFYFLFERRGLIGTRFETARADQLLQSTQQRQREVGNELYDDYSYQRLHLIEHLMTHGGRTQDDAIRIAQKVLDRIIFVAFCEDRELLPEKLIRKAYTQLPAFSKVTNPKWQNFKNLFGLIDKGDAAHGIPGFNGGLFRTDPAVDDLELPDTWTEFFNRVGEYDFRDEINVDVLGHLFERSVTELEKLRVVGLFGTQLGGDGAPMMPRSAERRRFGIYYTPPQFTRLIVDNTLGVLTQKRVDPLPDPGARIAELRKIRICDPACGSGAFLIAAYERLEDAYETVARELRIAGRTAEAAELDERYPDYILADNLFGADLSAESVEITQLALWIRSARKGRTLADLSRNILCGNSLILDCNVHPRAFDWKQRFDSIFSSGGFDVVIGNPPWERLKLQEREFFSLARPDIASAVSAADRRRLIARIESEDPQLWERYQRAHEAADRILDCVRTCGEYPLTGRGDVNTYMLFAELARRLVAPMGRVGLLVPSGIATDDTTKHFFNDLMEKKALIGLYDFENRQFVFPDVDGRFKFSVLLMGGSEVQTRSADFVFFAHRIEDLGDRDRHITLTSDDLRLVNPNTKTCPIFRTRRDAELTKYVYRQVPVLVDKTRLEGGNPWGVTFVRMLDQTNDAEHFTTGESLKDAGFRLDGNRWVKRREVYLPLYEAKMVQAFDHRAAGVVIESTNWMRQGQTAETSLVSHQNPEFVVQPRYWVAEERVAEHLGDVPGVLAFKDVTSATNQRTMIAAMVPRVGLMNSAPFVRFADGVSIRRRFCLLANLNAFAYDFIARQKVGGLHLNFFIVEQIPALPPDRYDDPCPWDESVSLETWVSDRALKLTCTANDVAGLADAAGFTPRVTKWKDEERAKLRAELDAAYFILYGIKVEDVGYILSTFQGVRDEDEAHGGIGQTRRLISEAYLRLVSARRS